MESQASPKPKSSLSQHKFKKFKITKKEKDFNFKTSVCSQPENVGSATRFKEQPLIHHSH